MSRATSDRRDLAAIAIGGILGATLRWWITRDPTPTGGADWFTYAPNTSAVAPVAQVESFAGRTLVVNLLGTLVLGAVVALRRQAPERRRLWLGVGAGFCGSLTTFSTFATDIATRLGGLSAHRTEGSGALLTRQIGLDPGTAALLYLTASLVGGAIAFFAGRQVATRLSGTGR